MIVRDHVLFLESVMRRDQFSIGGHVEFKLVDVRVEEIVPDSLPSLLTPEFFEKQSDEWFSKFYEFLSGQKAVVRDLLKKQIPFIRTEDGSHVVVKRNEQSQAFLPSKGITGFLTVKREVCNSPLIVEFLKSIGLSEPDPVDDVVQNVLCNYSGQDRPSEINYESDMQRILAAFSTDSDQGRRKLVDALRRASFVSAIEAKKGDVRLLKPAQVYRSTQRMKTVFDGVAGIWLVDDRLATFKGELMRDLLQACGALDVLRTSAAESDLTSNEKQTLRVKQGNEVFTWDRTTDDSDSADVAAFLNALPNLSAAEAKNRGVEFWLLLRETLRDRREAYFQARYVWGFGPRTCRTNFI